MARLVGLQDVAQDMRHRVAQFTRQGDEVLVLPTAYVSRESGLPKNVVVKLDGSAPGIPPAMFSEALFSGVSMLSLPEADALRIMRPDARQKTLARLASAVPSELHDTDLTVGPSLDGDPRDRDLQDWQCGFDSAHCCVGLYSSIESTSPIRGKVVPGYERAHTKYHLVCRAGAGLAASQFLTRLTTELNKGTPLATCLSEEGEPGAACLRRLSKAAERNRARVLLLAAEAFGVSHVVQSISDTASAVGSQGRGAQVGTTCSFNTLRPMDRNGEQAVLYASGCLDSNHAVGGLLASSNTCDGFVYLYDPEVARTPQGQKKQRVVINEAHNCVPFASERLLSNKEALTHVSRGYRAARLANRPAEEVHPDHQWVRDHFAWKNAQLPERGAHYDLQHYVPLSLWGTHQSENFMHYGRELALDGMRRVQIRPELVAIAGLPPARLRALSRHVSQPVSQQADANHLTPSASALATPALSERSCPAHQQHHLPPTRAHLSAVASLAAALPTLTCPSGCGRLASHTTRPLAPPHSAVGTTPRPSGPLAPSAVRAAMDKAKAAADKRSSTAYIQRQEPGALQHEEPLAHPSWATRDDLTRPS